MNSIITIISQFEEPFMGLRLSMKLIMPVKVYYKTSFSDPIGVFEVKFENYPNILRKLSYGSQFMGHA